MSLTLTPVPRLQSLCFTPLVPPTTWDIPHSPPPFSQEVVLPALPFTSPLPPEPSLPRDPTPPPPPPPSYRIRQKLTADVFDPVQFPPRPLTGPYNDEWTWEEIFDTSEALVEQARHKPQCYFGFPVVLGPSFRPPAHIHRELPQDWTNLMTLHFLFRPDVLDTAQGKVSVFPVTVYRTPEDRTKNHHGYPCVAVQLSSMKYQRQFFTSGDRCHIEDIKQHIMKYVCHRPVERDGQIVNDIQFDDMDDLWALSGLDRHLHTKQSDQSGWLLFPASWLRALGYYFRTRTLFDCFREAYQHHPHFQQEQAFAEDWVLFTEACLLGDQRTANIDDVLRPVPPDTTDETLKRRSCAKNQSLIRCRVYDGLVSVHDPRAAQPYTYTIPPIKGKRYPVRFHTHSFGYGVQVHRDQLLPLLRTHIFFSEHPEQPPPLKHMRGWYDFHPSEPVRNREEVIARGIHLDPLPNKNANPETRRLRKVFRDRLVDQYGEVGGQDKYNRWLGDCVEHFATGTSSRKRKRG